MQKRNH